MADSELIGYWLLAIGYWLLAIGYWKNVRLCGIIAIFRVQFGYVPASEAGGYGNGGRYWR